jgi:MFS family permease
VFAHRDFRLYFFGNLISSSGTWLQNVAQGVLVLELTGSAFMVGLTQVATFVPVLVLGLHGGGLADRFDRRKLLMSTQVLAIASTGALAILAATGHATVPAIMVVALLLGIQYAVAIPALQAVVPSLVPPEQLGPAVAYSSVTYNLARALGPLLATAAVAALGFGLAFGLNSLSFVALFVAVAAIRLRPGSEAPHGRGSIRDGLRYAWRSRRIRSLLILVTAISVATDPVYTLAPTFARHVFGETAAQAGLLVSAFGAGAILAALLAGRLFGRSRATRRRAGVAGLVVLAAGMAGLAVSGSLPVGLIALGAAGVGYLLSITAATTGIQETVPDQLRGRVMALWTLCFLGSRPLAALLDGGLADLLSPRIATLLILVPLIVSGAFLAGRVPGPDAVRGAPGGLPGEPV